MKIEVTRTTSKVVLELNDVELTALLGILRIARRVHLTNSQAAVLAALEKELSK